ncbi:MAG: hypothetical protein ACE5EC_07475, partial [Phycisphaerae bacterium]
MPSDPLPVPYASLPPIAAPPPPSPVAETDRLLALDVLRGVAILGILLVNIAYYALPARDVNRMRWWELPPADGALSLFVDFFCSFKFITLFSILFGMGLALQNESARRKGRPFLG